MLINVLFRSVYWNTYKESSYKTNYSSYDDRNVYRIQAKIVVAFLIIFSIFNSGPEKHNRKLLNP